MGASNWGGGRARTGGGGRGSGAGRKTSREAGCRRATAGRVLTCSSARSTSHWALSTSKRAHSCCRKCRIPGRLYWARAAPAAAAPSPAAAASARGPSPLAPPAPGWLLLKKTPGPACSSMAARRKPGELPKAPSSGGNGGSRQCLLLLLLLPPPLPAHTPVSREQPPGRGGPAEPATGREMGQLRRAGGPGLAGKCSLGAGRGPGRPVGLRLSPGRGRRPASGPLPGPARPAEERGFPLAPEGLARACDAGCSLARGSPRAAVPAAREHSLSVSLTRSRKLLPRQNMKPTRTS